MLRAAAGGAHRALLAIVFRAEHRLRPVAGYGISTSPGGPEQNRSASLNLFDIQQNAAIYRVQASLKERDKSCPPKPLTPALHPFRKAAERVRASTPSTLRRNSNDQTAPNERGIFPAVSGSPTASDHLPTVFRKQPN